MSVFLGANNIVSPLAFTSKENFDFVFSGKSAVQKHRFDFSENDMVCSKLNDEILEKKFTSFGKNHEYTRLEKMCIISIADVLQQSQKLLPYGEAGVGRDTLLIFSTTKGNIDVLANHYPHLNNKRAYLFEFAKKIGNYFHCANTPVIVSNACISGLLAMVIAKRYITSGAYKNIIVCGADIISEFTLSGFKSFNALSNERCKPFDAKRTGINLGEAAASVLLSSNEVSNIILKSGASANDANHISGPSRTGSGLLQAVEQTMNEANQKEIDFISAHGTATEYNDEMEAVAFSRAKLNAVPLNSLKAYYGHTLGAAGVLESVISMLSLQENKLVASLGFEETGTTQALNIITQAQTKNLKTCLKTASGFGGCNAAAIFEKI